jgi:hypothetical protein
MLLAIADDVTRKTRIFSTTLSTSLMATAGILSGSPLMTARREMAYYSLSA